MPASTHSSRSTHRSSPSSTATSLPLRQPRWRTTLASTTASTTAGTSYIFAEPQADTGAGQDATSVLKSNLNLSQQSATSLGDDKDTMERLTERLPSMEGTAQEEPVRFVVDDTMKVGAGAGTTFTKEQDVTSTTTMKDSTTSTTPPAPAEESRPALVTTPSAATTLVNAEPFPATTTNHSNPSLPNLDSTNHTSAPTAVLTTKSTPTKQKSTNSWLGSFSRTKGRPTSKLSPKTDSTSVQNTTSQGGDGNTPAHDFLSPPVVETPGVKVEKIDIPFPTPGESISTPAIPAASTAEGESVPALAPKDNETGAVSSNTSSTSSTSAAAPAASSSSNASTLAQLIPEPLSTLSAQVQAIAKPRSWFSPAPSSTPTPTIIAQQPITSSEHDTSATKETAAVSTNPSTSTKLPSTATSSLPASSAQGSISTHSLPIPLPASSPLKQQQTSRKPRSWFSSSPVSSSPLADSPSRRIASAAAVASHRMKSEESSRSRGSAQREARTTGGEIESSASTPVPGANTPTQAMSATRAASGSPVPTPPAMVHSISIDDAVPQLPKDITINEQPDAPILSPPMVGAVPPASRFVFGIPLLRGRGEDGSIGWGVSKESGERKDLRGSEVQKGGEAWDAGVDADTDAQKSGGGSGGREGDVIHVPTVKTEAFSSGEGGDTAVDEEISLTADIDTPSEAQRSAPESSTQESDANASAATSWWGLLPWPNIPAAATSTAASPALSNTSQSTATFEKERFSSNDAPKLSSGIIDVITPTTTSEATSVNAGIEISNESPPIDSSAADDTASVAKVQVLASDVMEVDGKKENKLDSERDREASASSAWYSPWAWYSQTCTNTTTQVESMRSGTNTVNDDVSSTEKREHGEGGKDSEALQNIEGDNNGLADEPENATAQAGNESESKVASHEAQYSSEFTEVNPIKSTIDSNRSGWASFFTSRTLVVKTLGYTSAKSSVKDAARDEDGNEVMYLDESDDEDAPVIRGRHGEDSSMTSTKDIKTTEASRSTQVVQPGSVEEGDGAELGDSNALVNPDGKSAQSKQPTAPPLTISEGIRRETVQSNPANKMASSSKASTKPSSGSSTPVSSLPSKRTASPAPSTKKTASTPPPNLVLPTWQDTFHTPPRNYVPPRSMPSERDAGVTGKLYGKTMKFVSGILFAKDEGGGSRKGKEKEENPHQAQPLGDKFRDYGLELPRAWHVVEEAERSSRVRRTDSSKRNAGQGLKTIEEATETEGMSDVLKGCKRVVVIGVHGWFPGAMMRSVLGEPTGTSGKFVSMMAQALEDFAASHGVQFEKITKIPLEGEGTIGHRVEKLYTNLKSSQEWMDDLHGADAIFVATHSQGSVVSTHLLDCLIRDRHIRTAANSTVAGGVESLPSAAGSGILPAPKPQRVCCLALCGIHLGPLRYLSSSSLLQPYFQYFESAAARELFDFQNTNSDVSKAYVRALENILANGTKMVYIASLNDQVVPIYSGLFTAASHPLILRALYIDGDAYHSSDFLSNLLVLMLRILNTKIPDSGLLAHLSEATAGSLNGVGHSTAYEELATYSLAVKYLFLTNDGLANHPKLVVEPFDAMQEQNDYEIPWALRDVIADERVAYFFGREITELRDAFREWHPKTAILRDLKRKLQPIQRLPASFSSHNSKL